MTDYEKYIALLNAFEIPYVEEITNGTPKSTIVYLAENFNQIYFRENPVIHNMHNHIYDDEDVEIKNQKVSAYSGFYCYFSFETETGKFEQVGIFE